MPPVTVPRTPIHDDDHSGTTGTSLDNAWKQEFYDQIDQALAGIYNSPGGTAKDAAQDAVIAGKLGATVITAQNPTGVQNNYALAGRTKDTFWQWGGAADLTLTGLANGQIGDMLTIRNAGVGVIYLPPTSGLSTAINTFANTVTSAPTPVASGGWASYVYNGTNWVLTAHEQGDWITAPYNAANFSGSGSQTWTVDAADIAAMRYYLRGRQLNIVFAVDTTSVGGTPSTDLKIAAAAYGGFTISAQSNAPLAYVAESGVTGTAGSQVQSSGPALRLLKNTFANWTASTNATSVYGQILVGVS